MKFMEEKEEKRKASRPSLSASQRLGLEDEDEPDENSAMCRQSSAPGAGAVPSPERRPSVVWPGVDAPAVVLNIAPSPAALPSAAPHDVDPFAPAPAPKKASLWGAIRRNNSADGAAPAAPAPASVRDATLAASKWLQKTEEDNDVPEGSARQEGAAQGDASAAEEATAAATAATAAESFVGAAAPDSHPRHSKKKGLARLKPKWRHMGDDDDDDPELPCIHPKAQRICYGVSGCVTIFAAVGCSSMLVFFTAMIMIQGLRDNCPHIPNACEPD